jgi:hypothetical protein
LLRIVVHRPWSNQNRVPGPAGAGSLAPDRWCRAIGHELQDVGQRRVVERHPLG